MRSTFRQGIARKQPVAFQRAGSFVNLVVSNDPTIIILAHGEVSYMYEETRTVVNAWGPLPGSGPYYLYWDLDDRGIISRGFTTIAPLYTSGAPAAPAPEQHWFDTTTSEMKVWDGTKWRKRIRVFGAVVNGATITEYTGAAYAGPEESIEVGTVVFDRFNKAIRNSDGTFLTTVDELRLVGYQSFRARFSTVILELKATENMAAYSVVSVLPNQCMKLCRSTDVSSRAGGIVIENVFTDERLTVVSAGLVRSTAWSWPSTAINRPIFCGETGELVLAPPQTGIRQQVGFVYDTDAIFVDIKAPLILDTFIPTPPPPLPGTEPIANFTAAPVSGAAPLAVTFTSTSQGEPTSYEWDFTGSGTIDSTAASATYTYGTPGTYSVRLKVTNAFGTSTIVKPALITAEGPVLPSGNVNLEASIAAPIQSLISQLVEVTLSVKNDGAATATRIVRTVVIPDVNGAPIVASGLPAGSSVSRASGQTLITLPIIGAMISGSTVPVKFIVQMPAAAGNVRVIGTASSQQGDVTVGDNTAEAIIQVRAI